MIDQVAGVILAGGKSSRFGSNKALARHEGSCLIENITARLSPIFPETLLVTNTPAEYAFLGWEMIPDRFPASGPLAGIHAALSSIRQPRAFVCGCDMPLVNPELIRFLCSLADNHDIVLPWLSDGPEPLYAVYSKSSLPAITENLQQGQRKIGLLFEKLRIRKVGEKEILQIVPDLSTFHNVNHQHDLRRLAGNGP